MSNNFNLINSAKIKTTKTNANCKNTTALIINENDNDVKNFPIITRSRVSQSNNSGGNWLNRRKIVKREPLFIFMMRLNLKALLLLLTIAVVVITIAVLRCTDFSLPQEFSKHWDRHLYEVDTANILLTNNANVADSPSGPLQNIDCWINQEYSIYCKHDEETNEIYVPFSFLRKYFEITGSITNSANIAAISTVNSQGVDIPNHKVFNWMHSNVRINIPKNKYDVHGVFINFENYNVEVRERVKCISAIEGVPVSTQWEKRGYFYPTQIAQFALSHYSKNITDAEPRVKIFEDADNNQIDWITPKNSNLTRIWHHKFNTSVIQYETAIDFNSAITLNIDQTIDLVLDVDILLVTNSSSLMIAMENRETKHIYRLHYIPANLLLSVQDDNIYYGLSTNAINKWRHLTRDLQIDVQKGLSMADKKSQIKIRRGDLRVASISFLGIGFFDNITLSTSNHLAHFYDSAEWFVNNQDQKTGGWPIPVKRNINGFAELKAGWLSAMGQGHAISVLARAYWHSGGDKRYLKAASLGLKPFRVLSKDGGVLAQFMEKYYWYEEYPTTPASLVLNGFIYSLFGLYDLNCTAPANIAREANRLYNQGMFSLKKMLLLYDTGSGTTYDLRHLNSGVAPNLARWDYHATHVNQLLLLATIDSDAIISQTAERWRGYLLGKRAKHN